MQATLQSRNELATYYLKDGILYGIYNIGAEVNLKGAKLLVEERLKLTGDTSYPLVVDFRGLRSMDKHARMYFASEEAVKGITAGAFIVDNFISKLICTVYLINDKPPRTVKVFNNQESAVQWLKSFTNPN